MPRLDLLVAKNNIDSISAQFPPPIFTKVQILRLSDAFLYCPHQLHLPTSTGSVPLTERTW
jgi:hypothetical protein